MKAEVEAAFLGISLNHSHDGSPHGLGLFLLLSVLVFAALRRRRGARTGRSRRSFSSKAETWKEGGERKIRRKRLENLLHQQKDDMVEVTIRIPTPNFNVTLNNYYLTSFV